MEYSTYDHDRNLFLDRIKGTAISPNRFDEIFDAHCNAFGAEYGIRPGSYEGGSLEYLEWLSDKILHDRLCMYSSILSFDT
jgi:hypothetical protein